MLNIFGEFEKPENKKGTGNKWDICPCGLEKYCKTPKFPLSGLGDKKVLIIRDRVSTDEDHYGTPLSDENGKALTEMVRTMGLDIYQDCWTTYASRCYYDEETLKKLCKTFLKNAVKDLKPSVILFFGIEGMEALKEDNWRDDSLGSIDRFRGNIIPDQEYGTWFIPLMPIEAIHKSKRDPVRSLFFRKDLAKAIRHINQVNNNLISFPVLSEKIEILTKVSECSLYLRSLCREKNPVTFDYETTGLKPNVKGHDIVCASFCVRGDTKVFMIPPELRPYLKLFIASKAKKIAQNISFEDRWSRFVLGTPVNNQYWDTMLGSHYLDNRGYRTTGLKFQVYAKFGITDYDSHLSDYLKAEGTLGFNQIHKIPKKELLLYCGKDSFYEDNLFDIQIKEVFREKKPKYKNRKYYGLDLLFNGAETLSEDSFNGLRLDLKQLNENIVIVKDLAAKKEQEVIETEQGTYWKNKYRADFNLMSDTQFSDILYSPAETGGMGLVAVKKTKKNNDSVDADALEHLKVDYPFIEKLIELRKLLKISDTYLTGWKKEIGDDPFLRPFVHLNVARTFRSSMSDPNLQNVPVRDPLALLYTRSCLKALYNHHLLESDYKSVEVTVGACYHKDPNMIKYLTDKTTDMHRDMAIEVFRLELENVSKEARQGAKNKYVFPVFYGSYWKNVAPDLWTYSHSVKTKEGMNLNVYLKKLGFTPDSFANHIKKVEKDFWGERFRGYSDWKENWWKEYQKWGYFDTLTGFRCSGILSKNEAVNYPIQGSAFHTLLTAKILTHAEIVKNEMRTRPCGQIHDSGLYGVPPEEMRTFPALIKNVWTAGVMDVYPWFVVPLEIDIEATPLNESWNKKRPLEEIWKTM